MEAKPNHTSPMISSTCTYTVPMSLGMPGVLGICEDIHALPPSHLYVLDFSETQHFEPFGMLILGSAIRRLKERKVGGKPVEVSLQGKSYAKQGHDYARRLGFWWSIGDDADLPTVKRNASGATIPVTRLDYDALFKEAGFRDPIRAEVVSAAAGSIATTLCASSKKTPLWLALEYCFREMFRNAFEHSRVHSVWYAGSTRRNKDDVQIAIVDGGRGIRSSLADNAAEQHANDEAALRAAMRPGVSRNSGRVRGVELTAKLREQFPDQDLSLYDNSGFGLTLTSMLGRAAGQFAIVSGRSSIAWVGASETVSATFHQGTAIRLVLHPSRIEDGLEVIRLAGKRTSGAPHSKSLITASMMSRLGLDAGDA